MTSTTARGYGADHQAERQRWAAIIAVQDVDCARPARGLPCLEQQDGHSRAIPAGSPPAAWDLGHTPDRTGYVGPEHRRCNRTTNVPGRVQEPASRSW